LHILYFTNGGSVHDYRFLSKLVEKKYHVSYVYLLSHGRDIGVQGLDHYYLPYDNAIKKGLLTKLLYRWRVYRSFRSLLFKLKPDILHAGWVPVNGFMAALSGYHPFLLMPMGSDILLEPRRGTWRRWVTNYALRHSDMITCDAETIKQEIVRLSNFPTDRIVTFPWGIDLQLFGPSQEDRTRIRHELGWENNPIIIMTRNMYPVYRVEDFVQAFSQVIQAMPEARALIIGEGIMRPQIESQVRNLGIEQYVRFLGTVPNAELPAYLNAADVYVSTSDSDGTSTSLLEAFACGLPVVVTDVPANLEWVQDGVNGGVAPRRNVASTANSIVKTLNDTKGRRNMGQRNLKLARERANWDHNFEKLEEIYEALIDRS
jgi:glycosyltransferase involved in cell wall biosynthesis